MRSIHLISAGLLLCIAGCNPGDSRNLNPADRKASASELPDLSIYNSNALWQTQNKDTLRLAKLQGKVQVLAMMYTTCEYTCPRLVADMKTIEGSIADSANVGLVLVSMDALRDTPRKLKAFANENNLGKDWLLLHGEENDILEIAAILGVQYKRTSETDFSHSNVLTVLNQQGEIVYQQNGLGVKAETIAAIKKVIGNGTWSSE